MMLKRSKIIKNINLKLKKLIFLKNTIKHQLQKLNQFSLLSLK